MAKLSSSIAQLRVTLYPPSCGNSLKVWSHLVFFLSTKHMVYSIAAVPVFLAGRTGFVEDSFSMDQGSGADGLGWLTCYIYCAFDFYYCSISSTSGHQDPCFKRPKMSISSEDVSHKYIHPHLHQVCLSFMYTPGKPPEWFHLGHEVLLYHRAMERPCWGGRLFMHTVSAPVEALCWPPLLDNSDLLGDPIHMEKQI